MNAMGKSQQAAIKLREDAVLRATSQAAREAASRQKLEAERNKLLQDPSRKEREEAALSQVS